MVLRIIGMTMSMVNSLRVSKKFIGQKLNLWKSLTILKVTREILSVYLSTKQNWIGFHSAPLNDSDIEAKPMVLLLGQYSTVNIHATQEKTVFDKFDFIG